MKEKIPFLLAAGILPLTAAASEQSFVDQLYLTGDIGPAFLQNTRIRGAERIDFNTGVRGDVAVGYRALPWLAGEFATGVIWNSADSIGGTSISSFGSGLDLYQIPIMGNAVFSYPFANHFKAYGGGGLGGVFGGVDFQRPLGTVRDTDFTFSYQIFAGVNYEISQRMEVGLGYKFLQTGDHDWQQNGVTLKTQSTASHSITASLTWRF